MTVDVRGATAGIIGLGGMGVRHIAAYKRLGVDVTAVCDVRAFARESVKTENPNVRTYALVADFMEREGKLDIVSVVTNTPSRAGIVQNLAAVGARRIITEKPFTTNVADAHETSRRCDLSRTQLTVNTFRHFCDNHIRLRELLRSGKLGSPRHFAVQCASTGLGNMGSVFFDLMNFYLESRPIEITGEIDRTGTPSPRGPDFRDPGGSGVVRYENGARGFIDTSEDTGAPYTFHIVTTYGRIFIDELFNIWTISVRSPEDQKSRPLTYYLSPLISYPFELTHSYDVVEMTGFTIQAALENRPSASNAAQATTVMEMIMAMHVSDSRGRTPVKMPLERTQWDRTIAFA